MSIRQPESAFDALALMGLFAVPTLAVKSPPRLAAAAALALLCVVLKHVLVTNRRRYKWNSAL